MFEIMTWCEAYWLLYIVESVRLGHSDSFSITLLNRILIPWTAATIIAIKRRWHEVRKFFTTYCVVLILYSLNLHLLSFVMPRSDVNEAIIETGVGHRHKIALINKRLRRLDNESKAAHIV